MKSVVLTCLAIVACSLVPHHALAQDDTWVSLYKDGQLVDGSSAQRGPTHGPNIEVHEIRLHARPAPPMATTSSSVSIDCNGGAMSRRIDDDIYVYGDLYVDGTRADQSSASGFNPSVHLHANVDPTDHDITVSCSVYSGNGYSEASTVVAAAIPDGEQTTASAWIWDTKQNYSQTLTGGTFSGRSVHEEAVAGGVDGCAIKGSSYAPYNSITGGEWTVQSNNVWQYDQVGYGYLQVRDHRQRGNVPCGTAFQQVMAIRLANGEWRPYRTNTLEAGITATTVWVSRAGVRVEKTY